MSYIEANGIDYYYQVRGSGPVLFLLHGFTGSSANWQDFLEPFSKQFQVLLVDLPGHGRSSSPHSPDRYSMEMVSCDLIAIMDTLQFSAVNLLGYSMGGRLALYMAVRFQNYFKSLIIESASPGLEATADRQLRIESDERLAAEIEADGVVAFIDRWQRLPLFATQLAVPVEKQVSLRHQRLDNSASGLANSLRGMGTGLQPSLWSELNSILLPVLVMAGDLDGKYTKIARQIAAAVPKAELKIFTDVGHNIHLEKTQLYTSTVLEFCGGL